MKVDIEDKEKTISVKVSVKPIHRKNYNVRIVLLTKDILKILSEKNIKVGKCIKSANVVTNTRKEKDLSGEWIFEKVRPPPKKASPIIKKPARTRKKSKKVQKILDKSPEHVIIEVQEKTLPPKEE